jgi:hypothetical protein
MDQINNIYNIPVGKPRWKGKRRLEVNIKMDFKDLRRECGPGSTGSGKEPMVGLREPLKV